MEVQLGTKQQRRGKARVNRQGKSRSVEGKTNSTEITQFRLPTTVSFPMNVIGFPDRLKTTLRYSEAYTLSNGTSTPAAQVWNINSAFDPNSTGTGHQPSFYDTFSQIYGRYFVEEFCLELLLANHTSNSGAYVVAGYSDQAISSYTVDELSEAKYVKSDILAFSTAGGSYKRLVLPWMSSKKLMGVPVAESDDNLYALISANPTDLAFAFVKVAADDAVTAISVTAKVIIHQRIVFKDLLTQRTS